MGRTPEPRGVARGRRLERDAAVGQLEVEQVGAHEPSIGGSTARGS